MRTHWLNPITRYEQGVGKAREGLFLVINNIDGPMLRSDVSQSCLSRLAAVPSIHIIASIDQLNAPLLWDYDKLSRFNWIWQDCTTFNNYSIETSYEQSLMASAGTVTVRATMVVMQSLTKNGRKVFWLLLSHQQKCGGSSDYKGLRFADYLAMCQQHFVAHDDSRLRAYMTEYEDHKLLTFRKFDGIEFLTIPVDRSMLESIEDMMVEHFGDDRPK
jgi:origin recognition complex subunit 2